MRLKSVSAVLTFLVVLSSVGFAAPASMAAEPAAPSWINSATVYEVNVRQFSDAGNFAAVTDALPRIKALGANVLWLMPIFPVGMLNAKGSLGSPYAVADYEAVNSDFGTDADFKSLVDTAHQLGMKVVLDWVANHTAWDNPWITEHPDWYTHDGVGNITYPSGTDWTDVADLNYDNSSMRTAMVDALKYWVSNFDIDGYRCDAAGMVPTDFWRSAISQVNQTKPLWWLAEDQSKPELLSKAFAANYNWYLLDALNHPKDSDLIANAVSASATEYPKGTAPLNFITNHDENSWHGTEFTRMGSSVRVAAAITFLAPGTPLLYNGQEIGMDHQLAFFEKDAISWGSNPAGSTWTRFYSKLARLKRLNPALWTGKSAGKLSFNYLNNPGVLSFNRTAAAGKVIFFGNLRSTAKVVRIKVSKAYAGHYYRLSSGSSATLRAGSTLRVTVPANGFVIFSSVKISGIE